MTLHEFDLIKKFFAKQTLSRNDVILDIGDDCAIVTVPSDRQLAITTDTLVCGVHFPEDTSAYHIGYKSLAVNLSDLAAMGATPAWMTLALTLPNTDETWLTEFCRGMFELAARYHIKLIGGDITRGPLTITIAAHGFIPIHQAITRGGAKPHDLIFVTHTLGDAAVGLKILEKKIQVSEKFQTQLVTRLNLPEPRIELGEKLRQIANAMIDISDGLAADLTHILEKSAVGATLYVDTLPLSDAVLKSVSKSDAIALALNGGDDYELCFTVPKEKQHLLQKDIFTCIGFITETPGLHLRFQDGTLYNGAIDGYQHF